MRQSNGPGPDAGVAALADAQWGVVSAAQLAGAGLSPSGISRRVRAGQLIRLFPGVYAVGHVHLRREGRWLAAVLSCGEGAVLSHRSAASLWDVLRTERANIDVTAPRSRASKRGIDLHRVRTLDPEEITAKDGVSTTTIARTLLDLAEVDTPQRLEKAVAEADVQRLLDHAQLGRTIARARGRRGLAPLNALLSRVEPPKLTQSELEEAFLSLVRHHGLPEPQTQRRIADWSIDFLWPAARLAVETDGRRYHAVAAAFERDRRKDLDLALAGYRTLRFTARQVVDEPRKVVAAVARCLA